MIIPKACSKLPELASSWDQASSKGHVIADTFVESPLFNCWLPSLKQLVYGVY